MKAEKIEALDESTRAVLRTNCETMAVALLRGGAPPVPYIDPRFRHDYQTLADVLEEAALDAWGWFAPIDDEDWARVQGEQDADLQVTP